MIGITDVEKGPFAYSCDFVAIVVVVVMVIVCECMCVSLLFELLIWNYHPLHIRECS